MKKVRDWNHFMRIVNSAVRDGCLQKPKKG